MLQVATYRDDFFGAVKLLWEQAYPDDPPWNRAEVVIPMKMASDPELLKVALSSELEVVGVILAGFDGHRGWLYSVTVAPSWQRRGVGSRLVSDIERCLLQKGCIKINVTVVTLDVAFLSFWHARGYRIADRVLMGKRLVAKDSIGEIAQEAIDER